MKSLFGTDGVRGIAGKELTCEFAMKLGIATAIVLTKNRKNTSVVIACDTRISKDMLVSSLIAGLCSYGVDVINLGVIPTPAVSYLIAKYNAIAGIMVTASHNPSEYNGIKIFDKKGYKLPDALETEIEDVINSFDYSKYKSDNIGCILTNYNPVDDYIAHLLSSINTPLNFSKDMEIAIDCANGSASVIAPILFKKLNINAHILNASPDGVNINYKCGSTHLELLKKYVCDNKLSLGIAYDGDADRCLMVDSDGKIIDGDYILAISALYLKKQNKLKNNTVVGTVMSNLGLVKFCEVNEINFESTKVGDRYVLEEMLLKDYVLGGEQSGHIIYKDYSNTGDGELTSLKMLEIIDKTNKTLKDLSSIMKKYPQVLVNVDIDNSRKNDYYNDDVINNEIDKYNKILNGEGRVLVRPSGTEPLIRVMIEGIDLQKINEYAQSIAGVIKSRLS